MKVHALCTVDYSFDTHTYEYMVDMPKAAETSHAEILLQLFTKINFEERSQIERVQVKIVGFTNVVLSGEDSSILGFSGELEQYMIDSFELFLTPAKSIPGDTENCPGCGCFLGGDLNPLCSHADGCGKVRRIPLVMIDEMSEDNRSEIYAGHIWNTYGLCYKCKEHKPNCHRLFYKASGIIPEHRTICLDCKKIEDNHE